MYSYITYAYLIPEKCCIADNDVNKTSDYSMDANMVYDLKISSTFNFYYLVKI